MEALLRVPFIQRNIIHYINHGLSYLENNIFNVSNNEDATLLFHRIYISNYSTSTNRHLLDRLGITDIITINSYFNPAYSDDVIYTYHYYAAYDDDAEDITPYLLQSSNQIKTILQDPDKKILIHCQAGCSRSVSLLIGFIARYYIDATFHWPIANKSLEIDLCYNTHLLTELANNISHHSYNEGIASIIESMRALRPQVRPNRRFIEQIALWLHSIRK